MSIKAKKRFAPRALAREFWIDSMLFLLGLPRIIKPNQLALAGISFLIYGLLTTWQLSVVLVAILVTHESGHLWAMHRYDLKPRGIFFIPFLGAATLCDEPSPHRQIDAIVTIAGPISGTIFAVFLGVLYWVTGTTFFAAAAFLATMINLLNLFPIGLLDGGQILKTIAYSLDPKRQVAFVFCGLMMALWIAFWLSPGIFETFALFGLIWFFFVRRDLIRAQKSPPATDKEDPDSSVKVMIPMTTRGSRYTFIAHAGLATFLSILFLVLKHEPGVSALVKAIKG